jgi:hypothetical protein
MSSDPIDVTKGEIYGVTPFFRDGDRPSDPKVKELITEIVKQLRISTDGREECEVAIRIQLQAAKGSSNFNKNLLPAGEIAENAEIVRSCLMKAKAGIKTIGAPFEALFDDETNYDCNKRHGDFLSLLEVAIRTADKLSQDLVIPKGQKPRDIDKCLAKTAADNLFRQFCTLDGSSLSTKRMQNSVAKLFYEYLTGNGRVDLAGPIADFVPEQLSLKPIFRDPQELWQPSPNFVGPMMPPWLRPLAG